MENPSLRKKLEPGIFQGTPNIPDEKRTGSVPLMRTMRSDMDLAVKTQKETLVSIAIAEEKKQAILRAELEAKVNQEPQATTSAPRPINRALVIIFGIFFVGILVALYVFISPRLATIDLPDITFPSFSRDIDPSSDALPTITPLAPSLFPAQFERHIDVSNLDTTEFLAELQAEKNLEIEPSVVRNIYMTESKDKVEAPISTKKFLTLTGVQLPNILSRSLEDSFMLGLLGDPKGLATPFMVLKVSSRESGLAGMLEWEQNIPYFFDTLFKEGKPETATLPVKFQDRIVMGRDARIFSGRNTDIAYSFANPNTIIITTSKAALETLLLVVGTAPVE